MEVGVQTQTNKSEVKQVKQGLDEAYPLMKELIEEMFPKKEPVYKIRLKDNGKVDLYVANKQLICYKYMKDYVFPLKVL